MAERPSGLDPALPELLAAVLACPACHGPLVEAADALECEACRLSYPVREGVPVLLADEARPIKGKRS